MRQPWTLLACILFMLPSTELLAQKESWVGTKVITKQPGVQLSGVDEKGNEVVIGELLEASYTVLAEQSDSIKVRTHYGKEGWCFKTDVVPLDAAPDYFTKRIQDNPNDSSAFQLRATAWALKGKLNLALKDLDEAIRLDPDNVGVVIAHGNICYRMKALDKAITNYSKAIKLNPKESFAWINRGMSWRAKKEFDKAIADFSEVIRLDPMFATAWYERGVAQLDKEQYDKAIADFNEVIRLAPDYADAWSDRGYAWEAKKDYDKAIADYSKAIELAPKFAWARIHRGRAWQATKEFDKAIADCTTAIQIDNKIGLAYIYRGSAWHHKGEADKAITDFSKAIHLVPDYADAWNNRGYVWQGKKEYANAIADYTEALRLEPDYQHALENFAFLLSTAPDAKFRDGKKAMELARKACELSKWKKGNALGSLSAAYAENGQFKEAVEYLEKAMKDSEFVKDHSEVAKLQLELYKKGQPYRLGMEKDNKK